MKISEETRKKLLKRRNEEDRISDGYTFPARLTPDYHEGHLNGMNEVLDALGINIYDEPTTMDKIECRARQAIPLLIFILGFLVGKVF